MKAVHFGAGSIGRGLIAPQLVESGAEVVLVDVDAALVDALEAAGGYRVRELHGGSREVRDVLALDAADAEAVADQIATADVVTTAVGVRALPAVGALLARGVERRIEIGDDAAFGRLAVLACENGLGATALLQAEVRIALPEVDADRLDGVAVFAETVVDRLVPLRGPDAGLDVTVEPFFDWVADRTPFGDEEPPAVAGLQWVDDVAPLAARKLWTLNTAHATAAYAGALRGLHLVHDALADADVRGRVDAVLAETRAALVAAHGLDADDLAAYGRRATLRLAEPALADPVQRVGRAPLRKLGRRERFVGPAALLAESGAPRQALLAAIGDALRFDAPDDAESAELQRLLARESPDEVVRRVTGVPPEHPLFADLLAVVEERAGEVRAGPR